MKIKRVLPADVYDTLELSALAYDGIGAGRFCRDNTPCCVFGHAYRAVAVGLDVITDALRSAGIGINNNDEAVERINKRKNKPFDTRVSFAEWCAELGVVRGDA